MTAKEFEEKINAHIAKKIALAEKMGFIHSIIDKSLIEMMAANAFMRDFIRENLVEEEEEDIGPDRWSGLIEGCDICTRSLKNYPSFIDGQTKYGHWALMCPPCFEKHGVGLGLGFGQVYDSKTGKKIEG